MADGCGDCVVLMILGGRNSWPRSCPSCGIEKCPRYPNAQAHLAKLLREQPRNVPAVSAQQDVAAVASRIDQAAYWDEFFGDGI